MMVRVASRVSVVRSGGSSSSSDRSTDLRSPSRRSCGSPLVVEAARLVRQRATAVCWARRSDVGIIGRNGRPHGPTTLRTNRNESSHPFGADRLNHLAPKALSMRASIWAFIAAPPASLHCAGSAGSRGCGLYPPARHEKRGSEPGQPAHRHQPGLHLAASSADLLKIQVVEAAVLRRVTALCRHRDATASRLQALHARGRSRASRHAPSRDRRTRRCRRDRR